MKKHELIFGCSRFPLDAAVFLCSFVIAYELRKVTDLIPGVQLRIPLISQNDLMFFAIWGTLIYLAVFLLDGMYRIEITRSKIQEVMNILKSTCVGFFVFVGLLFFTQGFLYTTPLPRLVLLFSALISIVWLVCVRLLLNALHDLGLEKGWFERRKVLLFLDQNASGFLTQLRSSKLFEFIGYLAAKENYPELQYLGNISQWQQLQDQVKFDEVFIASTDIAHAQREQIFEATRIRGIRYKYLGNFFQIAQQHTSISLLGRTPIVEIHSIGITHWGRIIKRVFDICFSLFCLTVLLPLCLMIAVGIKFSDPSGPVIFRNRRVGKGGELFDVYKFRYMYWKDCIKEAYGIAPESDPALVKEKELIETSGLRTGAIYKIKNDPRKMRIGKWLERFSLDEIPQFLNILLGQMSFIGPRPHQLREVAKYDSHELRVLTVKPGITGMAQVNGREHNSTAREVELDIFYIENWSLLLDLKILFLTLRVVLFRK